MRHIRFFVAATAVCVSLLTVPAMASNPPPFHFNAAERWLQSCNDEQSSYVGSCVIDPMECAWGDEDDVSDVGYGKLSAGQTVSDTLCIVTDSCSDGACPHFVDYQVTGPLGLTVNLTDDRGGSWAAPPVKTSGGYAYQLCFADPYYTGDRNPLDYPTIPGTNGGYGLLTHYTLTVTAKKTSNQVTAGLEVAQNNATGQYGYWHLLNVPCPWV